MAGAYLRDSVTRLETNLDDLSPELTGAVMERLLKAGALDVWFTPVQMKKNRPGVKLSLLCQPKAVEQMADIVFEETSAFGLRVEQVMRLKLDRRFEDVDTAYGKIRVKLGFKGERLLQASPEFESCAEASRRTGVPVRDVYTAAVQSAQALKA